MRFNLIFFILLFYFSIVKLYAGNKCHGNFINPITDICWKCLFPITIGATPVVSGDYPDTKNPSSPIQLCPVGIGYRPAMALGFWEPFAIADVTKEPFCLVNLGGVKLDLGSNYGAGGKEPSGVNQGAFYYVHWYKYPVIYWLNILTSVGCMQTGDMDIAYLTELDPTWDDDETSFILNPEAVLFSSPITQVACASDAISSLRYLPIDALFWCLGSQGGAYPLTGHIFDESSPAQASVLLTQRMDFKLHREGLITDSIGVNTAVCYTYPSAILPKSRYRYQMTNFIADSHSCHPFGQTTLSWESGHLSLKSAKDFGYLIWRKRNCAFL